MMCAHRERSFNGGMLRSRRLGVFRHRYEVSEDGGPAIVIAGMRREGSAFEVGGERYVVQRNGYKAFTVTGPNGLLARAQRGNGRTWTIQSMYGPLELLRTSAWKETWELRQAGESVGTLSKDGAFKRTSTADLPESLPLPLRLFVLCVVETLWERSRQSAAGAASV
jgi:hypothetical protein